MHAFCPLFFSPGVISSIRSVVAVLSAMYGITDHLVESVALSQKADMDGVRYQRQRVMQLHEETVYGAWSPLGNQPAGQSFG